MMRPFDAGPAWVKVMRIEGECTVCGGQNGNHAKWCGHRGEMSEMSGKQEAAEPRAGTWVKSSLSFANGNCVQVADLGGGEVGVRNSRCPAAVQVYRPDEWRAFIAGVKLGEFDGFGAGPAEGRPG